VICVKPVEKARCTSVSQDAITKLEAV